jgi:hypothetical protein
MGEMAQKEERPVRGPGCIWEESIKIDIRKTGFEVCVGFVAYH